jgi:paraquat-inducible protein A
MPIDDVLQPITVACPDCDLINQVPALAPGESASCVRCDATLSRNPPNSISRAIALTFTAIILYAITCIFPFLSAVVSFTTVVVPVFMMAGLCYLLLPLRADLRLPGAERILRWILNLQPWNMVEIFMIGIIVAGVKLQKMAALQPGVGAWAFIVLIFVMAAIAVSLEPRVLWERMERARCL